MGRVRAVVGLTVAVAALAAAVGCGGDADPTGEATISPPATAPMDGGTTAPAAGAPDTATGAEDEDEAAPTATRPQARPRPAPRALAGLPAYTAGFQRWLRLNAEPIPPDSADSRVVGFDAHRSTKQVYVNRTRAQLTGPGGDPRLPYPDGTIILKTGSSGDTITLIAVMRKIAGSDPAHGDWKFIEWKRASADEPFATDAGLQDATCWGCHGLVADDDWVFTGLDEAAPRGADHPGITP